VPVVLATRRSPLARAQTELVAAELRAAGHAVDVLSLTTSGDRASASGARPDDKGLFVKELELALLDGTADLAVHSAKDLPAELPDGLAIVAVPARADPRDALVGATSLADLPPRARVGTGSPRRAIQLRMARPDIETVEVRGNVDTRLRRLDEGAVDALVLAAAGLARLGVERDDVSPLPPELSTPAPGQGFLAIEGRAGDSDLESVAAVLDDPSAHACLLAERTTLAVLGGECRAPIGALCEHGPGGLTMIGFRSDEHGEGAVRVRAAGRDAPAVLGRRLADALLAAA